MLQLFPIYKKRMLLNVGVWIGFLAVAVILYPQLPLPAVLLVGTVVTLLLIGLQYLHAVGMHNGLLNVLYNELDAERFLARYEPLARVPVKSNRLYLMVRIHLSNAYCALGRFDDAIALLEGTEVKADKPENMLLTRFAVASNLCYCALQMNDLGAAQKHLDNLLAIKQELEALQRSLPERKRMVLSTALNEQCMAFLKTGKADIEFLKTQVQAGNNQQLHRVTTSLWIARAYLADNNRREAEKLLRRIVELAPDLYPGKAAQELLDRLPG